MDRSQGKIYAMDTANGTPSAVGERIDAPLVEPARSRRWSALRLAEVRLRLPMVLLVAALVVGRWDVLRNHWDRLTRRTPTESIVGHAVSADTEYFCPMDPGVVSDWPGRCGVCNMALVRRKKGEAVMLPDGVVARMQLSPYRVQLAGIQTAPIGFRAACQEWSTSGFVARNGDATSVDVELPPRQAPWIGEGSEVHASCPELPGITLRGRVRSIAHENEGRANWRRATIVIQDPRPEIRSGSIASVCSKIPAARLEPFCSMPRNPPQLARGEPRRLYVCADHADSTSLQPGRCPTDGKERIRRELADYERLRWWCPMHPEVTADKAGSACRQCGGMELRPRVTAYAPVDQVLAVPQSAVVDTGARKVVFVEEMPGMFDGVEVVLGPRCGEYYPVVRGLEPGQRVAVAGAFLLDAETRLNPSLAAGYFGASGGRRTAEGGGGSSPGPSGAATPVSADKSTLNDPLGALSPEDRLIADRQKVCPVTGLALGSMGTPDRQVVSGRLVFLCCGGCRSKLLADPGKFFANLPAP
jgi:membrane fusion protein, copper/silver efflux system